MPVLIKLFCVHTYHHKDCKHWIFACIRGWLEKWKYDLYLLCFDLLHAKKLSTFFIIKFSLQNQIVYNQNFHKQSHYYPPYISYKLYIGYINICIFFSRKHTRSSTSNAEIGNIENEYIRNLQQQIYFLELEANYLYPFYRIWKIKLQALSIGAAKIWMKDYTHINPMLTHLNSQILVFSDAVGKYCDSFIIIYPLLQQPEENKHVKPQVRSVE